MPACEPVLVALLLGCAACAGNGAAAQDRPFQVEAVGRFAEPWAMTFLPGGRQALITERRGVLKLWTVGGGAIDVAGVPAVDYGGQGGLGDVVLHPDFANNRLVYLSWVEAGPNGTRAAGGRPGQARHRLQTSSRPGPTKRGDSARSGPALRSPGDRRQQPKMSGNGITAHRLAFTPDGRHLFISSANARNSRPRRI